jgi:glucose-specific phosphotransferase system IIA component
VSSPNSRSFFSILQKVGQSLMVPVSVLPAAGLLVALARYMQGFATDAAGVVTSPLLNAIAKILFTGGIAIFEQLPVVFAIGVAIGFTGGAGVAGLSAVVGYFTLANVLKVLTELRELPLKIDTGVFGGIIIGLLSAYLYKRYYQTKLHPVFGFFAGKRLVPIITAGAAVAVAIALGFVWPPIQGAIRDFGVYVMGSEIGPAFYAAGKRLLIPVGLHHVYYPSFLYEFGEFVSQSGEVLRGDATRYFGGDPTAGRFMASEFPIMLFGLPAAALAMTLRARPDRRKMVGGVMLSAALTSIITGITEPIEFAFIFVAPILYVFHVAAAFCSGLLTNAFDIHQGYTFSASLIDWAVGYFNQKNSLALFVIVGPIMAAVYFTVFYAAIGLLNLKTPGREEGDVLASEENLEGSERAERVLAALGGSGNIREIDACITRLRLTVNDTAKVREEELKALGASGVMKAAGGNLQVVFGVESDALKEEIKAIMAGAPAVRTSPAKKSKAAATSKADSALLNLAAPLKGEVIPLTEVPDDTFASRMLGDGFAIDPSEGLVCSPADAEVVQVFRTQHALGLRTDEGLEILIHVGIDTVKMNGEGFKALVTEGQRVKKGDKLLEFDLELVKSQAKSAITPVIFTNMEAVKGLEIIKRGLAQVSEPIVNVELKLVEA